jgi:hypothetical protein
MLIPYAGEAPSRRGLGTFAVSCENEQKQIPLPQCGPQCGIRMIIVGAFFIILLG